MDEALGFLSTKDSLLNKPILFWIVQLNEVIRITQQIHQHSNQAQAPQVIAKICTLYLSPHISDHKKYVLYIFITLSDHKSICPLKDGSLILNPFQLWRTALVREWPLRCCYCCSRGSRLAAADREPTRLFVTERGFTNLIYVRLIYHYWSLIHHMCTIFILFLISISTDGLRKIHTLISVQARISVQGGILIKILKYRV